MSNNILSNISIGDKNWRTLSSRMDINADGKNVLSLILIETNDPIEEQIPVITLEKPFQIKDIDMYFNAEDVDMTWRPGEPNPSVTIYANRVDTKPDTLTTKQWIEQLTNSAKNT